MTYSDYLLHHLKELRKDKAADEARRSRWWSAWAACARRAATTSPWRSSDQPDVDLRRADDLDRFDRRRHPELQLHAG